METADGRVATLRPPKRVVELDDGSVLLTGTADLRDGPTRLYDTYLLRHAPATIAE